MTERTLLLLEVDDVLVTRTPSGEETRTSGSWELLSRLQRDGRVVVASLATRLPAARARQVLGDTGAGLARYLDLEVAGFGEDGDDLAAIVAAARERAGALDDPPRRVIAVCRPADALAAAATADEVVVVTDAAASAPATARRCDGVAALGVLLDEPSLA